jgi:hypothetical protein
VWVTVLKVGSFFSRNFLKMIKIGNSKYATIEEFAAMEAVTIQTIYNRIKEKKISTKKLLGKTLIELK